MSKHFTETMRDITTGEYVQLVSFDMSSLSAVVTNLYMEFLRSWLLSQHTPGIGCGSSMWMTHAASLDVDVLLYHLNSTRPTIKFTMEVEEGGSFPFLDTNVTRNEDGKLDITVYYKQTHTRDVVGGEQRALALPFFTIE